MPPKKGSKPPTKLFHLRVEPKQCDELGEIARTLRLDQTQIIRETLRCLPAIETGKRHKAIEAAESFPKLRGLSVQIELETLKMLGERLPDHDTKLLIRLALYVAVENLRGYEQFFWPPDPNDLYWP
ncbi:hypothetical protein IEN85_16250 [Pelagicoccus sp. NFK12]|uniref:Uncharacterized protein n=1 Tax=Pelagicoccus enzymogenes TaxID=2773457 RepID=A0A927F9N1_9BACT|nr:hypothetical protein [Pelagicoccus enzymogenes]